MCTSTQGNEKEDNRSIIISKVISLIVALTNVAGVIAAYAAYYYGEKVDFMLTMCAVLASFFHHLTATNRKLVPYYLVSYITEKNLLWMDRIFAFTLCVRGAGYIYFLNQIEIGVENYHSDMVAYILPQIYKIIAFAFICLFISDVLIKTAITTKMRLIYGIFHSIWHITIFFVWYIIIVLTLEKDKYDSFFNDINSITHF